MKWLKPRRLGEDAAFLAHALVHPAADGSVLLEAGAPMTDGRTSYLLWLRIDDALVTTFDRGEEPGASRWRSDRYGGPLARYDGRWYSHEYDEGGLADEREDPDDPWLHPQLGTARQTLHAGIVSGFQGWAR